MATCLAKGCSFSLLWVSFVNVCQLVYVLLSLFGFKGRIWELIVLVPGHCLLFLLRILKKRVSLCKEQYAIFGRVTSHWVANRNSKMLFYFVKTGLNNGHLPYSLTFQKEKSSMYPRMLVREYT